MQGVFLSEREWFSPLFVFVQTSEKDGTTRPSLYQTPKSKERISIKLWVRICTLHSSFRFTTTTASTCSATTTRVLTRLIYFTTDFGKMHEKFLGVKNQSQKNF